MRTRPSPVGDTPVPSRRSLRWWAAANAVFLVACTGLLLHARVLDTSGDAVFTLVDDAMISMRYADHLASGHGLVWNVGEAPIQGFTNLGWTLVMSVPHALGLGNSATALMIMVLGVALTIVTAHAVYRTARVLWPSSQVAPIVGGLFVLLDYGLVFWATRGMEVPALTALVATGTMLVVEARVGVRDQRAAFGAVAACAILAAVIRLDGGLPFAVLGMACGLGFSKPAQRRWWPLAGVLLGVGSVLVFQAAYFGSWLPNTYTLKVAGVTPGDRIAVGLQVLWQNAAWQVIAMMLLAVVGVWSCQRPSDRPRRDLTTMLILMGLLQVAYSVWVGGDYAEPQVHAPNRFILLGLPALATCAAGGVGRVFEADPRRTGAGYRSAALAAAVAAFLLPLAPNAADWQQLAAGRVPLQVGDGLRLRLGQHLAEFAPRGTVIATHLAGQIPYYSGLKTLDLLGKSDAVVAASEPAVDFRPGHNKWDYTYSIGQLQPDIIVDSWGEVDRFLTELGGYTRLENGIAVRNGVFGPVVLDGLRRCIAPCGAT